MKQVVINGTIFSQKQRIFIEEKTYEIRPNRNFFFHDHAQKYALCVRLVLDSCYQFDYLYKHIDDSCIIQFLLSLPSSLACELDEIHRSTRNWNRLSCVATLFFKWFQSTIKPYCKVGYFLISQKENTDTYVICRWTYNSTVTDTFSAN